MGRLFWKFFAFMFVAQALTVAGVSTALWLRHSRAQSEAPRVAADAPATGLVDAAAAALEHGGEASLRSLLAGWSQHRLPQVYAIDAQGNDLLGRMLPAAAADAMRAAGSNTPLPGVRRIDPAAGATRWLFVVDDGPRPAGLPPALRPGQPPPPRPPERLGPIEPIAGGIIASLIFAALLAAYVAQPIRSLRRGFAAAARGNLDFHLHPRIGRRRDELADLGRDFERTSARLKSLMDGQRRLLHDVSHELRSPLARLQAAVGLARQQPESIDASMDRIEREAGRMDALIDELLMLSRVEAGVLAPDAEGVDVGELLRDVADDARFEATAQGKPVAVELRAEAIGANRVVGRAELLHRAFDNVVRNALRHAAVPGIVAIDARFATNDRSLAIVVRDNGTGVPASELPSLFEPFFRGENAKGSSGHGLGLAFARSVVAAHGGTIVAMNQPEGGLAIEISLPLAAPDAADAPGRGQQR
jgi:two-component system OmpR family sensor kinase